MTPVWNARENSYWWKHDEILWLCFCIHTIHDKKLIKHGTNVFALCCAFTTVLLGSWLYFQSEDTMSDQSAIGVTKRLVETTGFMKARRCISFTDNWYTFIVLAKILFNQYKWRFCRTIHPTELKGRSCKDIPFKKL